MHVNIRIQWNAGTACVSECVLKTLACRGLRVGPSKLWTLLMVGVTGKSPQCQGPTVVDAETLRSKYGLIIPYKVYLALLFMGAPATASVSRRI